MRRLLDALFAALLALAVSATAAGAFDDTIGRRLVEQYGVPASATFVAAASDLNASVGALCAAPAEAALAAARENFVEAVTAYAGLAFLRFGPLVEGNRGDRVLFFPDPRGIGLRQIQALIAGAASLTAPAMPAKSAALQGLPALEFALFGTDSDTLATAAAAPRCAVAAAIAGNLDSLAAEIASAWARGAAFADDIAAPAADHALYRSSEEVAREALKAFLNGLAFIQQAGVGAALGEGRDGGRPRLAPFWRSGATFDFLAAEFDALAAFYDAANLVHDLPPGLVWLDNALRAQLRSAAANLRAVALAPADAFTDPDARRALGYILTAVDSMNEHATGIAAALGLGTGFNAAEGGD